MDLLNRAMQKPRAFHIEVVAELLLDVRTSITLATHRLGRSVYYEFMYIYNTYLVQIL